MEQIEITISHYLKELRLRSAYSQMHVAETSELSLRHYQDIEYGKRKFRIDTMTKILKVYNLTLFNFFDYCILENFHSEGIKAFSSWLDPKDYFSIYVDKNGIVKNTCPTALEITGFSSTEVFNNMFIWDFIEKEIDKVFIKNFFKLISDLRPTPVSWRGFINCKNHKKIFINVYWRFINEESHDAEFELISFKTALVHCA